MPTLTKKHYELIAEAIREAKSHVEKLGYKGLIDVEEIYALTGGIKLVENYLADSLATDNPRFNRERFLTACGIQ